MLEELEKLAAALEAGKEKNTPSKTAVNVIDLSLPYNHMFNPAAKRAMTNKVDGLIVKRKKTVIDNLKLDALDTVHFFAVIASSPEKLVKAARIITNDINYLSEKGYVTGCLLPLSCVKLATEPFQLEKYAVSCYVSLTEEGSKWLETQACGSHMKEPEKLPTALTV